MTRVILKYNKYPSPRIPIDADDGLVKQLGNINPPEFQFNGPVFEDDGFY